MKKIIIALVLALSVGQAIAQDYGRCEEGIDEYYRYTKVEDIEISNIERKADRIDISICVEEEGKVSVNINCLNKLKEQK